jgi:acetoin utilization deacetylase AcuC-like enzyme
MKMILSELKKSKILETNKISLEEPYSIKIEDLLKVHDYDYVKRVETICSKGGGFLDDYDTVVSSRSLESALSAVGGALKAVDVVLSRKLSNAFALVRPPGHHAGPNYAKGFCIFNNVALAATHLIKNLGFERVVVLDIDAHHGNGTQEIFFDTPEVLFISLHQDPTRFPQTGYLDEVGESEGLGYTVNIPLPVGTGDYTYNKATNRIIIPIIKQYRPEFILVSAGYDSHYADPIGELSLSAFSYVRLFGQIRELASQMCKGRLVAVLEGGYRLRILGKLVTSSLAKMAGVPYRIHDRYTSSYYNARNIGDKLIKRVLETQTSFWKL